MKAQGLHSSPDGLSRLSGDHTAEFLFLLLSFKLGETKTGDHINPLKSNSIQQLHRAAEGL